MAIPGELRLIAVWRTSGSWRCAGLPGQRKKNGGKRVGGGSVWRLRCFGRLYAVHDRAGVGSKLDRARQETAGGGAICKRDDPRTVSAAPRRISSQGNARHD